MRSAGSVPQGSRRACAVVFLNGAYEDAAHYCAWAAAADLVIAADGAAAGGP